MWTGPAARQHAPVSPLDWSLFSAYLALIAWIGLSNARKSGSTSEFFVAGRSLPWWAVGLSVMATQASAITVIGTTGKAYEDGMRFAQFYLGLPLAMAILAFTLVPLYHRAGVFTAYQLLGQRFDGKTRLLSSLLFLCQRSLSLGVVIYAPSIVLSLLLGWSLATTIATMTSIAVVYTVAGGIRAVVWTDVAQMVLILLGLGACLFILLDRFPDGASLGELHALAEVTGHTRLLDFSFDPKDRYTVWSGLFGGTLLFLSYFGCDQSQVQRFLSGRSLADNQKALLFNGLFKIPVQLFVLGLGVLLFLTFHFDRPPLLFDDQVEAELEQQAEWQPLSASFERALDERRVRAEALLEGKSSDPDLRAGYLNANARVQGLRAEAVELARELSPSYDDTNTVFPYFLLNRLPRGLVGLFLAVIFAAAMSSIDSELNALATTSVVDVYRVHLVPNAGDGHYVTASRWATALWGLLAALFALFAASLGSVIEAVNAVGSYFYGSLLGVFVLYGIPRANGHGAFFGLVAGMSAVALADLGGHVAWLWLNPIGAVATVSVGWLVSGLRRGD